MHWLFGMAVLGLTFDGLTTWFCLTHRAHVLYEGNPITALGIEAMGLAPFLLVQAVVYAGMLAAVCYATPNDGLFRYKSCIPATFAFPRWCAVVNNLVVLWAAW